MKKVLYIILSVLAFLYLTWMVVWGINTEIVSFITITSIDMLKAILYINAYMGIGILALTLLVYFWGKGIKILFLILTILVITAGVFVFGFPDTVKSIFGL